MSIIDPDPALGYPIIRDSIATLYRSGALTAATFTERFRFPWAAVLLGVTAIVNTAPTGATLIVDLNRLAAGTGAATTVFTTQANRPTVAISGFSSSEMVPDVSAMAAGDHLRMDIDQVGSTVAGSDLKVLIRYVRL